jgi:hypothetical protein
MAVWGISQEFEAKLAVAEFLKLYEDLKKTNWGKYMIKLFKYIYWYLMTLFNPYENELYTQMGDDYFKMRLN